MAQVAVVILNYNGLSLLQKYIPFVAEHHKKESIYIIDNQSTDDSVEWIKKNYPQITIIQNDRNYGYAKGYNEGLKHIHADYYVLMNNDIRTTDNWLSPMIEWMNTQPDVAVCMPKLLDDKHPSYFEYAGACGGFIDFLGYPFCRGRIFLSLEQDQHQYDEICEIFWATGACMVIKSHIFWEAGGFDEDFFAHMEEIDLCWRIKNIGYKVYVFPQSKIYHLGGGTLHKINPHKTYLNFRNSLFTLLKNHPRKNLFLKILIRLKLDGIAGIKFFLEGNGLHTIAVLKAHFHFYKQCRKVWQKRINFQKRYSVQYTFAPVFNKSIVFQYYIQKIKKFSQLNF